MSLMQSVNVAQLLNVICLFVSSAFPVAASAPAQVIVTYEKQSLRGVPKERCSENMQQIYSRTPIPKCDFNKVALQYY